MANAKAITLEVGATVNSTVGVALDETERRIDALKRKASQATTLSDEIKQHLANQKALRRAVRDNLSSIREQEDAFERTRLSLAAQKVDLYSLGKQYQALAKMAEGLKLQASGHEQLSDGRTGFKQITTVLKTAYKPVKASADFQAQIAGIAQRSGGDQSTEAAVAREVIGTSRQTGMPREQVVQLIDQMLDRGMSLQQARDNLGTAATFAVGQDVAGADTAALLRALQQAGLQGPQALRQGLEVLAAQASQGGFSSAELAKWVPKLLPAVGTKYTQLDAVRELGALLQAQHVGASDADDAAGKVKAHLEAGGEEQDFTGDPGVRQKMRASAMGGTGTLQADLDQRQALSSTKWSQSEEAFDDLLRSVGDGMRPVSDQVADAATGMLRGLTDMADAHRPVVTGLTALAGVATLAYGAFSLWNVGKGALDIGRGTLRSARADRKGAMTSLLDRAGQAARSPGFGFATGGAHPRPAPTGSARYLGGSSAMLGRRVLKRLPGGNFVDGALQLVQTFRSGASRQEKLAGYGSAVGGMGGTLAGAAVGAALGSVVPVVGTAIGGLLGGIYGGMKGEDLGGLLARAWTGRAEPASKGQPQALGETARSLPAGAAAEVPVAASAPPMPANQQFTFTANMPVTFNNSLDDPSVIQQLEQIARRTLTDLMARAQSAQMVDTAHV